jgi:hypothetical protein
VWQARDLPFNRYAWLTTHNSFARLGQRSQTGVAIATPWNQQDTVTEQLNVSFFHSPSCLSSAHAAVHVRGWVTRGGGPAARGEPRTQTLAST